MIVRSRGPTAHPLARSSPALNEMLRQCYLRAAFARNPDFSDVGTLSSAAVLGSVAHSLLEIAAKGEFDNLETEDLASAIERRWDERLEAEVSSMEKRALGSIPAPVQWAGYALKKASATRAASRIASRRICVPTGPPPSLARTQAEVRYEGQGGRLVGGVDLVRHTRTGVEIVDYKTGLILDQKTDPENPSGIRPAYRRQMLLSSSLVYENEGVWPTKVTLESLVDGPLDIVVTPEEATGEVADAMQLLDDFNLLTSKGAVQGTPSVSSCRWCQFKPVCHDFFRVADSSWMEVVCTVIGTLTTVHPGSPPYLVIEVTGGNHPRDRITVRAVPSQLLGELFGMEGSTVSFVGARRSAGSTDLVLTWLSQCWLWSDA